MMFEHMSTGGIRRVETRRNRGKTKMSSLLVAFSRMRLHRPHQLPEHRVHINGLHIVDPLQLSQFFRRRSWSSHESQRGTRADCLWGSSSDLVQMGHVKRKSRHILLHAGHDLLSNEADPAISGAVLCTEAEMRAVVG